jgi:serine/threonine-protein kinase HipA
MGNFGVFLDSSPDRWGQTLMKRREAMQAKLDKRTPRNLYAWDYLIGVQDLTRQGCLAVSTGGYRSIFWATKAWLRLPLPRCAKLEARGIRTEQSPD